MVTAYSPILKLALPVQGELSGTWGDVVNDNITSMVEQAIAGRAVIDTWTTNSHVLTTANGTTSESRCAMLEFTDTGTALSGAGTVTCPTLSKIYIAKNASGQNVTLKTSGGTGILVPNGRTMFLFCDGTNVVEAVTSTTSLQLGTSTIVTAVLDEDNMASDSATSLATQQSIKAYVDSQVGANNELSEVLANGNTTGATDIAVDSAQKVQFRDAAIYINSSVDGQLDIVADTEIQIAATTIDVNGALDVSGTALVTGVLTTTAATVSNGGGQFNGAINVGVDDTGYDVKFFGATTGKSLLWDESADSLIVTGTTTLVGTTNLDVVDIDGATQIDATVTVGVDDTGYDVKFFGATAGAYMLWDESADDLILGGAAGLSVNSTALVTGVLTTTAATVHTGGITMPDNAKAIFGDGSDLQIYHDSSNSYIADTGTGDLYIQAGNEIFLQNTAGVTYFYGNQAGQSTVGYAGTAKLATTSTGIDVTGTVVADGLTVDSGSGANQLTLARSTTYSGLSWSTLISDFGGGGSDLIFDSTGANTGYGFRTRDSGDVIGKALVMSPNRDISFYEDTGTTAKMVWSASDEKLTLSGTGGIDVTGTVVADGLTVDGNIVLDGILQLKDTGGTARSVLDYSASDDVTIATGTSTGARSIYMITEGQNALRVHAGGDISFYEGTGTTPKFFWDSSAESLGIGTSSPGRTLDVIGIIRSDGTSGAFALGGNSSTPSEGVAIHRPAADTMAFVTASTERMRIDSSGNLLVGTTTTLVWDASAGNANDNGISLLDSGILGVSSYQATANSGFVSAVNRTGTDGNHIIFRKDGADVGSIGTRLQDSQTNFFIGFDQGTSDVGLGFGHTSGTGRAYYPCRSDGSGVTDVLDIGTNDYKYKNLYLSGGVVFGDAGGSGTPTSNSLDSYEEGTFVPVLADATTGGNTSPTVFTGKYTKIGRLVHVTLGLFNIDTTGMTSGNAMYVRGLPFTPTASVNSQGSCTLDRINFTGFVSAQVSTAGAYLFLNDMVDSALEVILTVASVVVSGGSDMSISVTYMTDA
jgi:hypothetical protein